MTTSSHQLWPFGGRAAALAVPVILIGLLLLAALLRAIAGWPGDASEAIVLTGIFLLSLLPVILFFADSLVERGAVLEYKGLKLDFSRLSSTAVGVSAYVPSNIGVPGHPVTDSGTMEIMTTLSSAVDHDVVVVDLHDGDAWWETRLLVLVAGVANRQRPKVIVFIGKEGGFAGRFQGWGEPVLLLKQMIRSNRTYQLIYETVEAAAKQWEHIAPNTEPRMPPVPASLDGLASAYFWMAFDASTGLPNPLRFEQLLASELGSRVEMPQTPRGITLVRLEELFRPILHKSAIDETWPNHRQLEALFADDAAYVAITLDGRYQRLLPRSNAQNVILRSLTTPEKTDD
jgi:hypothetical protein